MFNSTLQFFVWNSVFILIEVHHCFISSILMLPKYLKSMTGLTDLALLYGLYSTYYLVSKCLWVSDIYIWYNFFFQNGAPLPNSLKYFSYLRISHLWYFKKLSELYAISVHLESMIFWSLALISWIFSISRPGNIKLTSAIMSRIY